MLCHQVRHRLHLVHHHRLHQARHLHQVVVPVHQAHQARQMNLLLVNKRG